jgi:hypothetical protein
LRFTSSKDFEKFSCQKITAAQYPSYERFPKGHGGKPEVLKFTGKSVFRRVSKVAATLGEAQAMGERWPDPDQIRPYETKLPLLLSYLEGLFAVYCDFNLPWT